MDIKRLIDKLKGKEEPEEEYEAKPIVDRHLDSLRRERQTQSNEVEKQELKKVIAEYKKESMRKNLYGIGKEKEKDDYLGDIKSKKVEIMNKKRSILQQQSMMKQKSILGGNNILNNHREEFKKKKQKNILF